MFFSFENVEKKIKAKFDLNYGNGGGCVQSRLSCRRLAAGQSHIWLLFCYTQ
jgi:hypothetical protein